MTNTNASTDTDADEFVISNTPVVGFFDGWSAACDQVEKSLGEHSCPHCALVNARFVGIAAAADLDTGNQRNRYELLEYLVLTALADNVEERADLVGVATRLVELQPKTARDAIVALALVAAKRYEGVDHDRA